MGGGDRELIVTEREHRKGWSFLFLDLGAGCVQVFKLVKI